MAKKATTGNGGGDAVSAPESGATKFGVYQKPEGSYTFGEKRFAPFTVVACGAAIADAIVDTRVKFFADAEKAEAEVRRLRDAREAKLKPKSRG